MGIMVTEDESDKRARGMREERQRIAKSGRPDAAQEMQAREMQISRTAVRNADPKKAYRLVNKDWKGRVGILKGKGYKMVPENDKAQLVTSEPVDGAQTHGDLVLMEVPIEKYERSRADRLSYQEQLSNHHAEASRENINRMARDAGLVGPHQEAAFDESRET